MKFFEVANHLRYWLRTKELNVKLVTIEFEDAASMMRFQLQLAEEVGLFARHDADMMRFNLAGVPFCSRWPRPSYEDLETENKALKERMAAARKAL